jgi:hypothetical protein
MRLFVQGHSSSLKHSHISTKNSATDLDPNPYVKIHAVGEAISYCTRRFANIAMLILSLCTL